MFILSEDHLDPLISDFVCGLDQPNNVRYIDLLLNKKKSNAFVPYRLGPGDSPPQEEGQICCFLVKGNWVEVPFCEGVWWEEATRIGYSRTNTRGTSWYNNGVVSKMILQGHEIPEGFTKGRIYIDWNKHSKGLPKGIRRFYNPETGEDGFFLNPPEREGFIPGIPPHKRNPGKPNSTVEVWRSEICSWYLAGLTTREIGRIVELSAPCINKTLKESGIPLQPIGGKRGKDLKPRKPYERRKKQKPVDN